jgi:hypothetical protein
MDLAVGIDVGFTANGRSTGVVIMDRATKRLALGCKPLVSNTLDAAKYLTEQVSKLGPTSALFVVDGPFAAALAGTKARLVERFFASGPFGSNPAKGWPPMRLMPGPTQVGSKFLASTRLIVDALLAAGHSHMSISANSVAGHVIEIFPTLFMGALLAPHSYNGGRTGHTDDLWLRLIGKEPTDGSACIHRAVVPYVDLIASIEAAPKGDLHDLRTAAISAIAADWFAAGPPGSGTSDATIYIGHDTEFGFVFPPPVHFSPAFLMMLVKYWDGQNNTPLVWI